jgi:hypothetical protein
MTLVVTPRGRGKWHRFTVVIDKPGDLFAITVGEIITLGQWKFRVVSIAP